MKIYHKKDTLNVIRNEMLKVTYYLFNEYEIHYNEQKPKSIQVWHHHEIIWETIYIIEGKLLAKWRRNGKEESKILIAGDLVETEETPHTFVNNSNEIVKFIVIKQILSGENKREILKKDKVLD
jgi:uncharacterized cupin superfamily protein